MLTLAGFALYAVVRACQVRYAALLGLRPEDLGLTYSTSLAGAASLAGFLAGLITVLLIAVWASLALAVRASLALVANTKHEGPVKAPYWSIAYFAAALVYCLLVIFIVIDAIFLPHATPSAPLRDLLIILVGVVAAAGSMAMRRAPTSVRGRFVQLLWRVRPTPVIALSAAVWLVLVIAARDEGAAAAAMVKNGEPTQAILYSINAQTVTVSGSLPRELTPSPDNLILLSATENRLTLYDPAECRFILLPADGVVIKQRPTQEEPPQQRPDHQKSAC